MVTRRPSPRLHALLLALIVGGASSGCAEDKPRCGTLDACDIRDAACQAAAFAYAACLRDRNESPALTVPVLVQSRDAFLTARVAEAQAADTPADRTLRRALALFGLSPMTSTPESETRARYQNVIAQFESSGPQIVVIDDGQSLASGGSMDTLVHEMVHALQHAAGELDPATVPPRYDAQLALSAIVEGEATIHQDETWAQGYGAPFAKLKYGKALSSFRAQTGPFWSLYESDIFDNLYANFSYAWGASYLWPLQRDQGAAAIAGAHAALPVSSYAVMELDPSQPTLRPNDLGAQAVPVLPGLTLVGAMHLGRFAYDSFTSSFPSGWVLPAGQGFVADTLSVFTAADGAVLAAWRFRFDDPNEVANAIASLMQFDGVFPVTADGADFWFIQAENASLTSSLPTPLTFEAAPAADLGFAAPDMASRIDCVKQPDPR